MRPPAAPHRFRPPQKETPPSPNWAETVEEEEREEAAAAAAASAPAADEDGERAARAAARRRPSPAAAAAHPSPASLAGPPPGFEAASPGANGAGVDDVAAALAAVEVAEATGREPDDPDLALKAEGLLDEGPGEIKTVTADNTLYASAATFEELGLSPELLQGLYSEMKFERPSRVQSQTLPMILTPPFRSLIAQAHNGSGKTTCFTLAMLSRVDPALRRPQALCVCPTRELVVQNLGVLERMGKHTGVAATSTAGDEARPARRARIDDAVVVGTHGRLRDWINKRVLPIADVRILVFDEADEMLKQDAFADDSVRLIKQLRAASPALQILLFSATFNERVKRFAQKIVPDANEVYVPREQLSLEVIKPFRVTCPSQSAKVRVLADMIFPQCERLGQTIIFVRTRDTARALHAAMEKEGHKCTSIEGGMDKAARDRVVREFRDGTTKILISTDVLSRGFDVTQVTLVVNFDAPTERDARLPAFETYLHRIGRSGRFGRKGAAFNLVAGEAEARIVDEIAAYFGREIPEVRHDDEDAFLEALKQAGLAGED